MDPLVFLVALIPALIYAFIIYGISPYKSINLKYSLIFLMVGVMSPFLVKGFWGLFGPGAKTVYLWMADLIPMFINTYTNYQFNRAFVNTAGIEEFIKVGLFLLIYYALRGDNKLNLLKRLKIHPIAIMFYCGLVALGFGVLENVMYSLSFKIENPLYSKFTILPVRSTMSLVLHLVSGLFAGYWIALGEFKSNWRTKSYFSLYFRTRPGLKALVYTLLGYMSAVVVHGLFDFQLFLSGRYVMFKEITEPFSFLLLMMCVTGSYLGGEDLNKTYKNLYGR